jgi:hypothetical protein
MHLAGAEAKNQVFRLNRLDGGVIETSLRYSACRTLLCGPGAEQRTASPLSTAT